MHNDFMDEIKEWDNEKLLGILIDVSWRLEECTLRADYDKAHDISKEVNILKYETLRRMKYIPSSERLGNGSTNK